MKKLLLPLLMLIVTSAYCQKNFKVAQFGSGPSVIIISDVPNAIEIWRKTINDLKDNYKLFFITFTEENLSATIKSNNKLKKELSKYINENNLKKSPIFGEGIGASISLEMAFEQLLLFSKIALINLKDFNVKDENNFRNQLAKINVPVLILNTKSIEQIADRRVEERFNGLHQKTIVIADTNSKHIVDNDNSGWLKEYLKNFLLNGLAN